MPTVRFIKDIDIKAAHMHFQHFAGAIVDLDERRAKIYTAKGYCEPFNVETISELQQASARATGVPFLPAPDPRQRWKEGATIEEVAGNGDGTYNGVKLLSALSGLPESEVQATADKVIDDKRKRRGRWGKRGS